MFVLIFQVCTKILEKNANPQWNQNLAMPIRVRHTKYSVVLQNVYTTIKIHFLCF